MAQNRIAIQNLAPDGALVIVTYNGILRHQTMSVAFKNMIGEN
jgi:hypothetical protein